MSDQLFTFYIYHGLHRVQTLQPVRVHARRTASRTKRCCFPAQLIPKLPFHGPNAVCRQTGLRQPAPRSATREPKPITQNQFRGAYPRPPLAAPTPLGFQLGHEPARWRPWALCRPPVRAAPVRTAVDITRRGHLGSGAPQRRQHPQLGAGAGWVAAPPSHAPWGWMVDLAAWFGPL
jgi:hypothetical protein